MTLKIRFGLPLALLCLSGSAWAAADVGGRYRVEGTNFNGSKYNGMAEITVSSNTTCHIVWHIGRSVSRGICMLVNDTLAAGYTLRNAVGLVVYKVKEDGTLDGIWTAADQDGAGTDVLIPVGR